jgi:hypothetical protein
MIRVVLTMSLLLNSCCVATLSNHIIHGNKNTDIHNSNQMPKLFFNNYKNLTIIKLFFEKEWRSALIIVIPTVIMKNMHQLFVQKPGGFVNCHTK